MAKKQNVTFAPQVEAEMEQTVLPQLGGQIEKIPQLGGQITQHIEGNAVVNISTYRPGIYLYKIGEQTNKFVVN